MFTPNFKFVKTIEAAADCINLPHEDYPRRVEDTKFAIGELVELLYRQQQMGVLLGESHIRSIHYYIMSDLESAGQYRQCNVTVGEYNPPEFYLIPQYMQLILPLDFNERYELDEIQAWYIAFETIHPFEDGNGRVGGIVLASVSKLLGYDYCVAYE